MRKSLIILSSILLLINAIAALYGGMNFILFPDGSSLNISPELLIHTPFHNYLIPGFVLVIANGLFSIIVFITILFRLRIVPWLIMAQGTILFGWITIQVMMIRTLNFHHFIFGSIGIILIITGWLLNKHFHDYKTGDRNGL